MKIFKFHYENKKKDDFFLEEKNHLLEILLWIWLYKQLLLSIISIGVVTFPPPPPKKNRAIESILYFI